MECILPETHIILNSYAGRVLAVAFFQSMIMKPFIWKENSRKRDFQLIVTKVEHYRSQLGFPKQDSEEFGMLSDVLKEKMRKFYLTSEIDVEAWLSQFNPESDDVDTKCVDEYAQYSVITETDNVDTKSVDEDTVRGEEESESGEKERESSEKEFLSWLDVCNAIEKPYWFVYNSLHSALDEMKELAVEILNETAARSQPDFELAID